MLTAAPSSFRFVFFCGFGAAVLTVLALFVAAPSVDAAASSAKASGPPDFVLNEHCPPSFELTTRGVGGFRHPYELYDSLEGRGVGGTRTSLPPHRDGFTPT